MIYVGQLFDPSIFPNCPARLKGKLVCHMLCDPGETEQLHTMAQNIGCKRTWFQDRKDAPHYDIVYAFRAKAIALGAIEIDNKQEVELLNKHREASKT